VLCAVRQVREAFQARGFIVRAIATARPIVTHGDYQTRSGGTASKI
jgi:hypothetical protein